MHAALARALPDWEVDRQAWHRAAASLGPDEEVAAALEEAGQRARARSAYAAAATAAERAAGLTPRGQSRARRLLAAAEAAWLGGHADRALTALEEALALAPEPRLCAKIEHLRGQAVIRAGDVMTGHDVLVRGANTIAALDPGMAVEMLAEATDACVYAGRPEAMLDPARRAYDLLPGDASDRERFFANLALGTALIYSGEGDEGTRMLREAVAVLEASDILSSDPRSLSAAALAPLWLREAEAGESLVDRAIEAARGEGALGALPFALTLAARDAATSDRWAVGRSLYDEAIALARETDQAMPLSGALAGLASIHARQGDAEACEAAAAEALELSERHGLGLFRIWALDALAELELGLGRLDKAVERLQEKQQTLAERALTDPDLSPAPELVEAAVRGGGGDGADLETFARFAQRKGQPWALARLERSRGLLASSDGFDPHFAEALRLHESTPDRFEHARTHLCFGESLRRAGQRVRAREQLRAALEAFDELGAAPWAERARSELLATGERARRRDPSTLDELTPQELQIGMVLASGHTTREAAAKLFLSPKTVEYHLRNVYRKLGIHSREELARELAEKGAVQN
jgi:DNA-binding CsgD family transcriptional regulator